jgi:hypothetical protein
MINKKDTSTRITETTRGLFAEYVNSCIEMFKSEDTAEIIQCEYKNLSDVSRIQYPNEKKTVNCDLQLMKLNQDKASPSLDGYVSVIKSHCDLQEKFPEQKKVQVNAPVFKTKGLKKVKKYRKKNISVECIDETQNKN